MARLVYGRLREAWHGEARDFTPLLAEQLDDLGEAIGVQLSSIGKIEVPSEGGRRIDIVADSIDGGDFVIENQYGVADHDHLTRGLAYAVARSAKGLVVVAENHREEFRSVADYLNRLAELDPNEGIPVWLVEAKAVRIGESPWAPLFTVVSQPNSFNARVEKSKADAKATALTIEDLLAGASTDVAASIRWLSDVWRADGFRPRPTKTALALEAPGPAANGYRTVLAVDSVGTVIIPLGAYRGVNTGVEVEALTTDEFCAHVSALFGVDTAKNFASTRPGWFTSSTRDELLTYARDVARIYADAMR